MSDFVMKREVIMSKKLVIVESPTKTKTISKILGKDYKVIASKGHLRDLPKSSFGVDLENNFEPKYIKVRGKAPTINFIKKEHKNADQTFLATDPDREGEAISWHLAHLLGMDPESVNRVSFREITKEGVKEGISKPRKLDLDLVDAQQARRVMDRIVGYEISPILWKKVKSGLSAGRVQSVALRLIVEREREIEAFEPKEYWTVHTTHNKDKINFETEFYGFKNGEKSKKFEIENQDEADRIINELGEDFRVSAVKKTTKKRRPYAPFTTSTMQQEASAKLNFTTSKTMMLAQQLYEGVSTSEGQTGLITYMRTDSTRLSHDFTSRAKKYIEETWGKNYAGRETSYGGKKGNTQDAHEAIRPTSVERDPESLKDYLTKDQYKLYKLIWARAVASQMKASSYKSTNVEIINGNAVFKVNGIEPDFDGFQKVWPVNEKALLLPELAEGDILTVVKVDKRQHFTQPPARYSEASLVKSLEQNGIGRPSTYAGIIKSVQNRRYAVIKKKYFYPTELGIATNDLLEKNFPDIININFTAEMEKRLDDVADGNMNWKELMARFYSIFSEDLEKAKADKDSYKVKDKPTGEKCPECGHDLVYKNGRNGSFIACSNFPDCKFTKSIVKTLGIKCPKCGGDMVEKVSKRGKVFYGCSNYPECDYATWDKPTGEICPKCGDLMVHKKNRKVDKIICSNEKCENHDI